MCTQQCISNYLCTIRKALYKEFVPFYLGANSKNRDFFVKQNTKMVKKLYNLKQNDLVLVADGTYCRIEKSCNHQFQYDSYSSQKFQNLVKPFFITTANGYIVDCYGPFMGRHNDSFIFKYILENDAALRLLMTPNETLVLVDRGN